jgi:hypothetical protein
MELIPTLIGIRYFAVMLIIQACSCRFYAVWAVNGHLYDFGGNVAALFTSFHLHVYGLIDLACFVRCLVWA